jgi:hypothetical protein
MDKATAPRSDDGSPSEDVLRRMRIPFVRRASVAWDGREQDVFVIDLALAGVFVEWPSPPPIDTRMQLTFRLPDNEIPIVAGCRVAWCHQPDPAKERRPLPPGAGLEFVSLASGDADRLRQYLVDYYRREPRARRFIPHGAPREGGS